MNFIFDLALKAATQVLVSLQHNWPYLLVSVLIATLLKQYVNAEKISAFLKQNHGKGVIVATAAAVATPLCSCGTTAVVLGMMASTMHWAPIVAFMVASPLSSPEGLVYSAGIFGWPFAITFYMASIFMGLGGGWLASILENRGWLNNQTRFAPSAPPTCACPVDSEPIPNMSLPVLTVLQPQATCCTTGTAPIQPSTSASFSCDAFKPIKKPGPTMQFFLKELYQNSKNLLTMFLGFAFIGYFLNGLIPAEWMSTLFGSGNVYNVPLAATLGLPFYINSEASLPLVRAMMDNGMSQGAALAFMISGAGTSMGAITGALAIARWRIVALVVGILWIGAILSGLIFNWAIGIGLF